MRHLSPSFAVSPQISPDNIPALVEQGVKAVLNNRPDHEAPGQPTSDEIRAACDVAGICYAHVPMGGGLSAELIERNAASIANGPEIVLAYCASGTRSSLLWCFANVVTLGVDAVIAAAGNAGYQFAQYRPALSQYLESQTES